MEKRAWDKNKKRGPEKKAEKMSFMPEMIASNLGIIIFFYWFGILSGIMLARIWKFINDNGNDNG